MILTLVLIPIAVIAVFAIAIRLTLGKQNHPDLEEDEWWRAIK